MNPPVPQRRDRRPLSGMHVAITGGARGIGLAIAREAAARGAAVSLGDLDGALVAESAASLPTAAGFAVDVSDATSFARFVDGAESRFGPIDVLVNNAGVMHIGPFLDETDARLRRMIDVNLFGVVNGLRAVLPRMIERGSGHVVNVASTAGKVGVEGGSGYCSMKHAVVGLSESVRAELRGKGIGISVVMPGPVNTELAKGIAKVPIVGLIEPEQVAAAVLDAVGTKRFEVFVPRSAGVVLRTFPAMPRRLRDRLERTLGFHRSFTQIDTTERARYDARVAEAEKDAR